MKKIIAIIFIFLLIALGIIYYLKEKVYVSSPATTVTTQSPSMTVPLGYISNPNYRYQGLESGMDIIGVQFKIPERMATGTNLASDTYISLEQVAQAKVDQCSADFFLAQRSGPTKAVQEGLMTYSFATSSDAAAGNRYEERVYAIPGTNPCLAVRYFIHSNVIANYEENSVKEFDMQALINSFDEIRRTLVLGK